MCLEYFPLQGDHQLNACTLPLGELWFEYLPLLKCACCWSYLQSKALYPGNIESWFTAWKTTWYLTPSPACGAKYFWHQIPLFIQHPSVWKPLYCRLLSSQAHDALARTNHKSRRHNHFSPHKYFLRYTQRAAVLGITSSKSDRVWHFLWPIILYLHSFHTKDISKQWCIFISKRWDLYSTHTQLGKCSFESEINNLSR